MRPVTDRAKEPGCPDGGSEMKKGVNGGRIRHRDGRRGDARAGSLGQKVRVRGAGVHGEVYLVSYARVAPGPQFSVFARTRQPPGPWEPSGPRLFDPFTATDG